MWELWSLFINTAMVLALLYGAGLVCYIKYLESLD